MCKLATFLLSTITRDLIDTRQGVGVSGVGGWVNVPSFILNK